MIADEKEEEMKKRDRAPCWFGRCRRRRTIQMGFKVKACFGFMLSVYIEKIFQYR